MAKAVSYKVGSGSTEKKLAVVNKNLEQVTQKRDEEYNILQGIIQSENQNKQILNNNLQLLEKELEAKTKSGNLSQQEQQILEDGIKEQKTLIAESNARIAEQQAKYKSIEESVKRVLTAKTNLVRKQEETNRAIEVEIANNEQLDNTLVSIGNTLGKKSKLYEDHAQRIDNIKGVSASILAIAMKNNNLDGEKKEQILGIVQAYKEQEISIANIQKEVEKGNLTQEQAADQIKQVTDNVEELISRVDLSGKEFKELREVIKGVKGETAAFAAYAEKAQLKFTALDNVMSNFGGIPATRELGEAIKTNTSNTVAFTGAMMALGAAIASAAYKFFGAEFEISRKIKFDTEIAGLKLQEDLIKNSLQSGVNLTDLPTQTLTPGSGVMTPELKNLQKNPITLPVQEIEYKGKGKLDLPELEKTFQGTDFLAREIGLQQFESRGRFVTETLPKLQQEVKYAGAKAGISFSDQFQQGAAQFKATAITARFGEQLAKTGFSAGKLQLAGIDPTQISDAMSKLALETGKVPTAKLGAEMALIAKRTGQSVDGVASLTKYFMSTDKLSEATAVNMVEGMRAMAEASNLDLGNLMEGVAEASKDALSYQIRSGEALAKQVAASQSIGVNFNKLASAGRSMVLNYKDSIKSEMQLSSMLGRSVNLSEVRMKAMTGDYAGMMQALKAQGLNPADMNMFEQEAFSQALGGMDLGTLDKIFKGEIKTPADLQAGNAGAAGAGFLDRTKQAQSALATEQAVISANTAVLSGKLEQKMQEEFIKEFQPGIEKFNLMMDALKKRRDEDLQTALKSTKAYLDLETTIEKQTQKFDYMGNAITGTIAALGAGIFALAGPKILSGIKSFRGTPGTTTSDVRLKKDGTPDKRFKPNKTTKPTTKPSTSTGPKPKAKAGMSKNLKRAGVGGLIVAGGIALYNYFSNRGEESQEEIVQEPEVDRAAVQEQLKAEYLQSTATNNVAQQVGLTNDLLKDANSELAYTNKANMLSGVCSCIATNMQQNLGLVVDELKKAKEAENFAYKGAYAETQGEAFKGAVDTARMAAGMHVGIEVGEKGVHKVVHKGKEYFQKKAAEKIATEGAETVAQTGGKSILKKGAQYVGQKYTAALTTKAIAPLVSASKIISKGVNPAGWIGVGAEIAGEYMKGRGKEKADKGLYDTGRATQTAGATLAYGAMGATIGSIIPGIGTAVGAAIGGLFGLTTSLYSNYFSEDAKKEAAQIEQAEKEKLRIELLNSQIDSLLAIQKSAITSAESTMKSTNQMAIIASDENSWRTSMLLQTVEMTRLLSIISSNFVTKGEDGKLRDKLGNVVESKNYDQLDDVKAKMGVLEFKDERQKNLASTLSAFSEAAKKGITELSFGNQKLSLEQYKKKYKVSDDEFAEATRIKTLMSRQRTATVTAGPQVNVTGGQGGVGGVGQGGVGQGGVGQGGVGGKGGEGGVGGAAGNTTIDLSPISSQLLAMHATLKQIEANILTQYVLQAQSYLKNEERYTAKTTMDTITNTTITNISTDIATIKSFMEAQQLSGVGNGELNVILKQIQMEAHSRGIQMYSADVKQVNNTATLSKEVITSRTIEQGTNTNTKHLVSLNDTYSSNIEAIQIEMLKTLQDNSELLGAIAKNTLKVDTAPIIKLDGSQISRSVVDRQANRKAFNQSRRLKYGK